MQRPTFARAGCRPAPPPRTATLDSVSGTHDRRLEPDHEAFGRAVSVSDAPPAAPPGLDAPQRSVASQEDADGWVTRSGQQRHAAAAPLPTTLARNLDGRALTREPQALACAPAFPIRTINAPCESLPNARRPCRELHAQDDVKHLFNDYKPDVRDPSNTMIRIATRDFDPDRMRRACKLMDSGVGLQRAAKEVRERRTRIAVPGRCLLLCLPRLRWRSAVDEVTSHLTASTARDGLVRSDRN